MFQFFILFCFFLKLSFAETVIDLNKVNFKKVSNTSRPLVYSSSKFNIYLMNGFCQEEFLSEMNLSKEDISRNIFYFKTEIPKTLAKWENLLGRLSPDFFKKNNVYPLQIYLSLDGSQKCYNAQADKNKIEFPLHKDRDLMKANYDLIYHELGHVMRTLFISHQNIYEEAFADAISLLLFDGSGVFYHGIEEEREEWQRQIALGKRDPHALASELGMEYFDIPFWVKENELKYDCSSNEYFRDLRNSFSILNIFKGSGEEYIVSCAFHSYLRKLSFYQGHKNVLEKFVKAYLDTPNLFADLSVPSILFQLFTDLRIYNFDPTLSDLL